MDRNLQNENKIKTKPEDDDEMYAEKPENIKARIFGVLSAQDNDYR
jgi:hypothetical protein